MSDGPQRGECPMCGGEVRGGDAFCPRCGEPMHEDSPEMAKAARELARPSDGAGTRTWGLFLWMGLVLCALGALGSLVWPLALFKWLGWGGVIIGFFMLLQNVAFAALFDAVLDLRWKVGPPPVSVPPPPAPPITLSPPG